jgi:hypothetical protein
MNNHLCNHFYIKTQEENPMTNNQKLNLVINQDHCLFQILIYIENIIMMNLTINLYFKIINLKFNF